MITQRFPCDAPFTTGLKRTNPKTLFGLLTILLISCLPLVRSAIPQFTCPVPGSSPVRIPSPAGNSSRTVYLDKSQADTLCTLTRLTPLKPNVTLVEMDSWDMAPIARSYLSYDWEPTAGPYAASQVVSSCGAAMCTVVIPSLPSTDPSAIFVLTSYKYSIDTQSEAARFLEQATFGPTRDSVAQLGQDLQTNIPLWIKNQMNPDVVPPTYHREYFRRQESSFMRNNRATLTGVPRHPCNSESRWRRHSFTFYDRGNQDVTLSNLTDDSRLLISIKNIPRTVVSNPMQIRRWTNNQYVYKNFTWGSFNLCWSLEEKVGGLLQIQPDNDSNCYDLVGGNPVVELTDGIQNNYSNVLPTLNLPPLSTFVSLDPILYGFSNPKIYGSAGVVYNGSIYNYNALNNSTQQCDGLPVGDFENLVGLFSSGEKAYYDGRIELNTNTLESPIADGGGNRTMTGALCANVPKNFLNIKSCVLSREATSCRSAKVNPTFNLNQTNVRMLFEVTGRYVYTIRNLGMNYVAAPCTPYVRARWIKITDTNCITAGIDTATNETLVWLFQNHGWDSNGLLVDIHLEWIGNHGKTCNPTNTVGMKLLFKGACYQHIHPDEYSVYDFTYWTLPNTHPGNTIALANGRRNPIKKWAEDNQTELFFPSWHPMDRWENNKKSFDFIGRFGNNYQYVQLPSKLRSKPVAEALGASFITGETVVVCGSSGEVSNNPSAQTTMWDSDQTKKDTDSQINQKKVLWNLISLSANDQLRQRMAWALSQILVITPNQINDDSATEMYANYYDIFVRNAFGNYRDVLKEVAYSPMMAEMLSYLESKSSAYVLRTTGAKSYPDENFAREVMQLFSIGVEQLNRNGLPKLDPSTGLPIPTYENSDIQTFARAWTGFLQEERRSNIELGGDWEPNRIDPMQINPNWRDMFPKMDLNDGFIGDGYPLCSDLPEKQFLKLGAKYILLGSSSLPEYQTGEREQWAKYSDADILRLTLNNTSQLVNVLCNATTPGGECNFRPVVVLEQNLNCTGVECSLDNLRAFKVQQSPPVYYEYVRPACVELSFYNTGKKISKRSPRESMCANTLVDEVMDACCPSNIVYGQNLCEFTGERVKYSTGASRCKAVHGANAGPCNWEYMKNDGKKNNPDCLLSNDYSWHWTNMTCTVRIKVNDVGNVATVHDPDLTINNVVSEDYIVRPEFDLNNTNYFMVKWESGYFPSSINNCGNGVCALAGGACYCDVTIVESRVFNATPATAIEVVTSLFIGSVRPDLNMSGYTNGLGSSEVQVYHRNGGSPFDMSTIFGVVIKGKAMYFKNMQSMVVIKDSSGRRRFQFRNPPHFLSFIIPDIRDAEYETDAVLDHYFYHDNVAPFLAIRIIQRFGISNPSPRYVQQVARAFAEGSYMHAGMSFGDSRYGSLSALIAATLLDPEARSVVLDVDPSSGSIREPMIKLIAFLRAMNFQSLDDVKEVTFRNLQNRIGQMPHSTPNVFSYFQPDYASGKIKSASLFGPETQVLTSPTIVGFINGMFSLVDLGLTNCYGGFGETTTWWCEGYNKDSYQDKYSRGFLGYSPVGVTPSDVTDELAMLLTGGRLSSASRNLIKESNGLETALKLIVTTPEFHSTRVVTPLKMRPNMIIPASSGLAYKAVVFVNLEGGMDSYNVLMPHSGCSGADLYAQYATIRGELALPKSNLLQIDANTSAQPCSTFGLHPNLGFIQQLYNDGDLAFLANTGVLQQYVTKDNWWKKTSRTSLFAHNTQQDEVNYVDILAAQAGRGVLGRMIDILKKKGYKTGSMSISGIANALVSFLSPLFVLDPYNYEEVNPIPWAEDIVGRIKQLNNANQLGSSLFGDAWSNLLIQALGENKLLFDAITSTTLNAVFPDTVLAQELKVVAKMIKTKDVRGSDRDTFYVDLGGFDTHNDMIASLGSKMTQINGAMAAFVAEMKSQGRWDDVVVVFVSEFGRTLTPNTSQGSDHAWGGNYFYAGGSVAGKRILGKYPSDLTSSSPYRFDPGVVIPTTSWDEFWVLVAKWYGITSEAELTQVAPNRQVFSGLGSSL